MTVTGSLWHGKGILQSTGGEKSVCGHLCFPLIVCWAIPAIRVKGKRLGLQQESKHSESLFPWNPIKHPSWRPMLAACSIIPQPSAFQWLFSSTSLPGVTGCTSTASPSIPESFPLKQIPQIVTSDIQSGNQAEQRRKSRRWQSKLSPYTWRKRTSFHMHRAAPFSTAVSKIGINY